MLNDYDNFYGELDLVIDQKEMDMIFCNRTLSYHQNFQDSRFVIKIKQILFNGFYTQI